MALNEIVKPKTAMINWTFIGLIKIPNFFFSHSMLSFTHQAVLIVWSNTYYTFRQFTTCKHQEALYFSQTMNHLLWVHSYCSHCSMLYQHTFASHIHIRIWYRWSRHTVLSLFSPLPQLPIFFFCRDFNHTWFINNSSCSISFFNNANNPSLISFLLLNILAVSSSLLSW
jgi:hypothetical protein